MDIVIDTSVFIAVIVGEPERDKIIESITTPKRGGMTGTLKGSTIFKASAVLKSYPGAFATLHIS